MTRPPRLHPIFPLTIAAATALAYANSTDGVFLLDDNFHITQNKRIETLWPPVWLQTTRPIVKLSLALNHRFSGLDPAGYHLVNIGVHVLAALALFGLVRRALAAPRVAMPDPIATFLAYGTATLWALHPIQTQAVTYVIQRAESMMGLLFLVTVYCALRGIHTEKTRWLALSVAACALGMTAKAVIVTAPLIVLGFDALLFTSSLAATFKKRWPFYLALVATIALLIPLGVFDRAFTQRPAAGFGLAVDTFSPLGYLGTQVGVVAYYLLLVIYPNLCFLYDWPPVETFVDVALPMLVIAPLIALTGWATLRKSPAALPGLWFFVILAPTSALVPIRDPIFEYRMYLPSAAVILAAVLLAAAGWKRLARRTKPATPTLPMYLALGLVAATLGLLTFKRNGLYGNEVAMWRDVVEKQPDMARGHLTLANALSRVTRIEEAVTHARRATELDPGNHETHYNLGNLLLMLGKTREAADAFRRAVEAEPRFPEAHVNLGLRLVELGQPQQALEHYNRAIALVPNHTKALYNRGTLYLNAGRLDLARADLAEAVRIDPEYVNARNNLGITLLRLNLPDRAATQFEEVLKRQPGHPSATVGLRAANRQR